MYKKIKAHPSPRDVYAAKLAQAGTLSAADAQKIVDDITNGFIEAQKITKAHGYLAVQGPDWGPTIQPILDENIIKIILGDQSPADGVTAMHDALLGAGLIDE
jgi:hypothetical protein